MATDAETLDIADDLAGDLAHWRRAIAARMDCLERKLDENTKTTKRVDDNTSELVSAFTSLKGAMETLAFLGKLAKPLAVVGGILVASWVWIKTGRWEWPL